MYTGWVLYHKNELELNMKNDYNVLRLLQAAEHKGIELHIYKPEQFDLITSRSAKDSILIDGKPSKVPAVIIPWLEKGTNYFALAILRQLEQAGLYSCNTTSSIELAKDKLYLHQLLAQSDLPTPKTMLVTLPIDEIDIIEHEIGFPLVMKHVASLQGRGSYKCEKKSKFTDLVDLIYDSNPEANIILQEYIEIKPRKDIKLTMVGGRVTSCICRKLDPDDMNDSTQALESETFEITPEIEWLATETARLTGLDVLGLKLLPLEHGYKISSVTATPDFKEVEDCIGKIVVDQILDFISIRIGKWAE